MTFVFDGKPGCACSEAEPETLGIFEAFDPQTQEFF